MTPHKIKSKVRRLRRIIYITVWRIAKCIEDRGIFQILAEIVADERACHIRRREWRREWREIKRRIKQTKRELKQMDREIAAIERRMRLLRKQPLKWVIENELSAAKIYMKKVWYKFSHGAIAIIGKLIPEKLKSKYHTYNFLIACEVLDFKHRLKYSHNILHLIEWTIRVKRYKTRMRKRIKKENLL